MTGSGDFPCLRSTTYGAGIQNRTCVTTSRILGHHTAIPHAFATGVANGANLIFQVDDFITGTVIVARGKLQVPVISKYFDILPCFLRTLVENMPQIAATRECVATNTGNTLRDRNTNQPAAIFERKITNTGNTLRNGDTGQAVTILERIITNAGNAIRNCNVSQAATIAERIIANAGNTLGDGNASQTTTSGKHRRTNTGNTLRQSDTGQTSTGRERIRVNVCNALGECNFS